MQFRKLCFYSKAARRPYLRQFTRHGIKAEYCITQWEKPLNFVTLYENQIKILRNEVVKIRL